MSPRPRPVTIDVEPGIDTAPIYNVPIDPPQSATSGPASALFTVQIGSKLPGLPPNGQQPVDRHELDADTLEDLDFPQRLAVLGDPNLFRKDRYYDIELATLQRMVIHDLQHRLVRLVAHIHNNEYADEGAMDTAKRLLDDYCKLCKLETAPTRIRVSVWRVPNTNSFGLIQPQPYAITT